MSKQRSKRTMPPSDDEAEEKRPAAVKKSKKTTNKVPTTFRFIEKEEPEAAIVDTGEPGVIVLIDDGETALRAYFQENAKDLGVPFEVANLGTGDVQIISRRTRAPIVAIEIKRIDESRGLNDLAASVMPSTNGDGQTNHRWEQQRDRLMEMHQSANRTRIIVMVECVGELPSIARSIEDKCVLEADMHFMVTTSTPQTHARVLSMADKLNHSEFLRHHRNALVSGKRSDVVAKRNLGLGLAMTNGITVEKGMAVQRTLEELLHVDQAKYAHFMYALLQQEPDKRAHHLAEIVECEILPDATSIAPPSVKRDVITVSKLMAERIYDDLGMKYLEPYKLVRE